jgi:hypothetical protein
VQVFVFRMLLAILATVFWGFGSAIAALSLFFSVLGYVFCCCCMLFCLRLVVLPCLLLVWLTIVDLKHFLCYLCSLIKFVCHFKKKTC